MNRGIDLYLSQIQKAKYENLYDVLCGYESRGIRISVQGVTFPAKESAEIMSVNEGDCFMPDIILDNFGKVVEVNYDKIVHM